ncbi:ATP-binding cassette domain-containing protein, partial [Streptomyces aidingensis]
MSTRTRKAGSGQDGATEAKQTAAGSSSASEQLLFGGPLQYNKRWTRHQDDAAKMSVRHTLGRLPRMLMMALRLAWQADRPATVTVIAAEVLRGITQAVALLGVQAVLEALLAPAEIAEGVRAAASPAVVMALALAAGALLAAVTTYADGRLRPQVEQQARQRYLQRATEVELEAIEDHAFHALLESAQYGAQGAREVIGHGTRIVGGVISLITAGGVLTALHPLLLPMLLVMVAPRAWAALRISRQRYESFHIWVQHTRAFRVLSQQMIDEDAAAEIRVHRMGGFLLHHHEEMARAFLIEQRRLARVEATTLLVASIAAGVTAVATYTVLGWLLWSGAVALAAAGAAVAAIQTGTGALANLVSHINRMHEDSLYVADLHQVTEQATGREIPAGGHPLPEAPRHIHFDNVTFTYPSSSDHEDEDGEDTGGDRVPALNGLTMTIPLGKVTALVGNNGSGKSTIAKLLAGLYRPQGGRILWDGTDTATADRAQLFSRFSFVTQDFYRWPFTARINVAVGDPSLPLTQERLEAAAAKAGATDLIASLPQGWRTLLSRTFQR